VLNAAPLADIRCRFFACHELTDLRSRRRMPRTRNGIAVREEYLRLTEKVYATAF
jgi:hypothetical protein